MPRTPTPCFAEQGEHVINSSQVLNLSFGFFCLLPPRSASKARKDLRGPGQEDQDQRRDACGCRCWEEHDT